MRAVPAMLAFFFAACNPAYAPPPRAGMGGAPASPKAGRADVGAAAFFTAEPVGETGDFSIGVNDWVQVEGGAWGAWVEDHSSVLLGYAGARVNPLAARKKGGWIRLTSDVEMGGGLGVGGRNCASASEEACEAAGLSNRLTGGGYVGGSIGFQVSWFDMFMRARLQLSDADEVPLTFWYMGFLGAQVTILKRLRIFFGGGWTGYENSVDGNSGLYGEGGFAVMFYKRGTL